MKYYIEPVAPVWLVTDRRPYIRLKVRKKQKDFSYFFEKAIDNLASVCYNRVGLKKTKGGDCIELE